MDQLKRELTAQRLRYGYRRRAIRGERRDGLRVRAAFRRGHGATEAEPHFGPRPPSKAAGRRALLPGGIAAASQASMPGGIQDPAATRHLSGSRGAAARRHLQRDHRALRPAASQRITGHRGPAALRRVAAPRPGGMAADQRASRRDRIQRGRAYRGQAAFRRVAGHKRPSSIQLGRGGRGQAASRQVAGNASRAFGRGGEQPSQAASQPSQSSERRPGGKADSGSRSRGLGSVGREAYDCAPLVVD
jgi:hypothetical protein